MRFRIEHVELAIPLTQEERRRVLAILAVSYSDESLTAALEAFDLGSS